MKNRLVNRLLSLLLTAALVIGMIPEFILTASAAEPTGSWMNVNPDALKAIVDDDTDSNGDGLADQLKRMLGLDPESYDTNEDGLTDVFKLENGLNPLSSDTYDIGISDLVALTEGDLEVEITSDLLDTDTDADGTYTVDLKVKLAWLVVGQTQNITDSWSTPIPVYYNDKPVELGDFGADNNDMQYIGSSLYVSSTGELNLQIAWRDSDGVKIRRYMNLVYDEDRICYNASTRDSDLLYTNFDFEDTGETNYETYYNIYKYYQRSKLILGNADDGFDLVSYTLDGTTATFSALAPQNHF